MELQQLKYFLQICEDRNYAVAAGKLFISQQALRKSVKKLEDEVGLTLVYRKGNELCLTPVGENVRAHAAVIMNDMGMLEDSIEAFREDSGYTELTVAIANGCYDRLALSVIEPYKRENPNISIKVTQQADLITERSLLKGLADFGFTFGPNDENIFEVTHIGSDPTCVAMRKDDPLANKKVIKIEDLRGRLVGICDERYKINYLFRKACRDAGFEPSIDLLGGDPFTIYHYSMYTGNLAISVGLYYEELDIEELKVIPLDCPNTSSDFNLLVRRGVSLSHHAQKFIDYCKGVFATTKI